MTAITILLCRLLCFLGGLVGRGSSLPGAILLKLDRHILDRIQLPPVVIAVTGTNGKTSTTELIRTAAEAAGKRVVCNSEGSNQIEGVTTALLRSCNLRGVVQADCAVLESDERFCQYTFSHFAPTHMVVTNLYRDQLTRNGHNEFVLGEVQKGLPAATRLILNADDPLSATLGIGRPDTLYFGVSPAAAAEPLDTKHAYFDGAFCPVCKARMTYDYRIENHLGGYRCPACGFRRAAAAHEVTALQDGRLTLDGKYAVTPQLPNLMFAYNIAAAFTAATEALGIAPAQAAEGLDNHALHSGRVLSFDIAGHKGLFQLSKHENSMAYNGALRTILDSDSNEITVVLLVDLLSRKYVANDMSWLWDIDFELLADPRVKRIFVGGKFANDVACRLLVAGVAADTLHVEPDLDALMDALYGAPAGDIYALTCFTDVGKFTGRLRGGKAQ